MIIGYKRRRWIKGILILAALLIGVASLLYTNYLVDKLMKEQRKKVKLWADAQVRVVNSSSESGDISFLFHRIIQQNKTVPVILVNEKGDIISYRNLDSSLVEEKGFLQNELEKMKSQKEPIEVTFMEGKKNYIYYRDSLLINQLRYYPYVQLFVITLFGMVAYLAFSSTRKYEQNRVWVGLAKETAHQLGTPLSSLIGWVEYLKASAGKIDDKVLGELEKDVKRLQVVTDRFSKVGSVPYLETLNINELVTEVVQYFETRFSASKINISVDRGSDRDIRAKVNRSLFEWVLENLVKNAIDALDQGGNITFCVAGSGKYVQIDVTDTGRGIPRSNFKSIFNPGYSTRKRGWGLGLSLAKRIVEEYHKGQIYVKSSELNKGTTIRIRIPV